MPTTLNTSSERRLYERFSARFPVKFKDTREEYGTSVFLRDASAQGMRVLTKERFFIDDQIVLECELPDGGDPMVLTGRVVWAKLLDLTMWDLGVQFHQVNFFKMQRIFKLTEDTPL